MLPFPSFSYEAPDTLDDLVALAAEPGARLIAGGTDLLPSMKHRLFRPGTLVSLGRVGALRGVCDSGGELSIAAGTTLREVARDPIVAARYPALRDAVRTIATSTIQAMATLGGNVMLDTRCLYYNQPEGWRDAIGGCLKADGQVCHVAPNGRGCYAAQSSDSIPVLWLYGAELELVSTGGTRRVAVRDLFDVDGRTWLKVQPGEVLTRVILPPPPEGVVVHRKLRARGAIDYGLLLTAVHLRPDGGARAVIGAVAPHPIEVDVADVAELAQAGWKAAVPMTTHAWPAHWRKHMVRVELARAAASAAT
jgi:4-hydroxybenzoyl-CoA reductase subunit beta